jgi:N6-L-threonylcarbamoyladenine synthase
VRVSFAVRQMESSDVPAVLAIERQSFGMPWTRQMFEEEVHQDLAWRQVAQNDGEEVAGFLLGREYPDAWHLMDLAVAPGARRRGAADSLLGAFVAAADEAERPVFLEVRPKNVEAMALYKKWGFIPVGLRKRYYTDTGEDALVMMRPVGAAGPLGRDAGAAGATRGGIAGRRRLRGPLLAIESSCDDSSAAVLSPDGDVLSNVVHSQDAIHERYGGVVPEVASRAHVERMTAVVREALAQAGAGAADLGGVAVTVGPGLIGALLVGVQTAKAIAWAHRLPLFPVNHLHGHLAAVWLADHDAPLPMVTLVASGGHTSLVGVDDWTSFRLLGQTLDDAAGEAFDKGARLLGLGYPGGRELDQLAEKGDPKAFAFPVALKRSPRPDFSFSGVKTALFYLLRDMTAEERSARAADVAASYREAIVEALVSKSVKTAKAEGARTLGVAGGVAANSLLRRRLVERGEAAGLHVVVPPFAYCTDNAAMIGAAALAGPSVPYPDYLDVDASASLPLGRWSTLPESHT